jgi:hypothetical protein
MSHGLRVWNSQGQLRLDTRDRTMRLTSSTYVAGRELAATTTQSWFLSLPGFNPAVDGAFLSGAEAGYLGYDAPEVELGFLPELEPVPGGVELIWRGYPQSGSRTIRYMGVYVMVLRAS